MALAAADVPTQLQRPIGRFHARTGHDAVAGSTPAGGRLPAGVLQRVHSHVPAKPQLVRAAPPLCLRLYFAGARQPDGVPLVVQAARMSETTPARVDWIAPHRLPTILTLRPQDISYAEIARQLRRIAGGMDICARSVACVPSAPLLFIAPGKPLLRGGIARLQCAVPFVESCLISCLSSAIADCGADEPPPAPIQHPVLCAHERLRRPPFSPARIRNGVHGFQSSFNFRRAHAASLPLAADGAPFAPPAISRQPLRLRASPFIIAAQACLHLDGHDRAFPFAAAGEDDGVRCCLQIGADGFR